MRRIGLEQIEIAETKLASEEDSPPPSMMRAAA